MILIVLFTPETITIITYEKLGFHLYKLPWFYVPVACPNLPDLMA